METIYKMRLVGILLLILTACSEPETDPIPVDWTKEKSTRLNKEITEQEKIDIELYKDRIVNSSFEQTGSGLNIWVKKEGEGENAEVNQWVQVRYKISLLDGTVCYETEENEIQEFKVDKSDVETGIQEGIKRLNKGAQAMLIIPSHLAHGLTGDSDQIPPLTAIVVEIEVVNIR